PGEPDRQLVRDEHDLAALDGPAGVVDRRAHAGGLLDVRLTPGRAPRVDQAGPVLRATQRAVADAERLALEVVGGLDEALVGPELELERTGDRGGGLLRALQRRGGYAGDVVVALSEERRDPLGHGVAELGQVVAGDPSVEDSVRVVDLAVPHQVNSGHGHGTSVPNFPGCPNPLRAADGVRRVTSRRRT